MISEEAWRWCCEQRYGTYTCTKMSIILPFSLLAISCYILLVKKSRREKAQLPPGPRGLPIIGNLPFLDPDLHSCFAQLAERYGPVMKILLGTRLSVVLSSPSVAREVLKDYDTVFADRDQTAVGLAATYGGLDMAAALYGDHWRMLRKLCVKELISHVKLEALYGLRRREARHMVNQIYSMTGKPIDIGETVMLTMFNIITSMMWGSTLEENEKSRVTAEFRQVAQKMVGLVGELNISDLFPVLAPFDIQGKERKMKKIIAWFDKIFDHVIDRRREIESGKGESKSKGIDEKDFLQILLQLIDQRDQKTPFTRTHLKALFVDMAIAGTKTTSTTVEWAVAELMKQPEIMRKVKQELEEVVGMNNTLEESHLPKLRYLDAVVKEVLRLHPTAPLLLPRCSRESCTVGGYRIPKGTRIFVNVWAIQRDPKYWDNSVEFRPERFLNSANEWDFNGNDFRYMPFGSGRRICVGIPMAERLVPYLLGSLLHSFRWELPGEATLDLSENFGIELTKKTPLVAIPTPRFLDAKLYA